VIYSLIEGKMVKTGTPQLPSSRNFLIVCSWGDWSGFRLLADCEAQFAELEANAAKMARPNFYYQVVER
jgi:hypothetical protein